MKIIAKSLCLSFIATLLLQFPIKAQTTKVEVVDNDIENFKKLQIRPHFDFFIPAGEYSSPLPTNFNIDAQYWMGSIWDARAGIKLGSMNGFTAGGTLHLKDRMTDRAHKFVLSRTTSNSGRTETVNYIKKNMKARVISGPCADVFIGNIKGGGFHTQLAFGLDFQRMSKASIKPEGWQNPIQASSNGWYSLKLQAVVQSLTAESAVINYKMVIGGREMGFGGQADVSGSLRPWKKATLHAGLSMGAIKVTGVTGSVKPILSIRFGMAFCQ